ncbi:MAG: hypothetical protein N2515_11375, partial [Deltaproteobacteria bacterium]|nr:hypothetical protein [Deltaproteobacteria bacterium]
SDLLRVVWLGEMAAIVGVQSVKPNPLPWSSRGRVPRGALLELKALLKRPELEKRFLFIALHYGLRRANGAPDRFFHRLVNAEEFLSVLGSLRRGCILHGHIHRHYALPLPGLGVWAFCAGSTTAEGRGGIWFFELGSEAVKAVPGRFIEGGWKLIEGGAIRIPFALTG